MEKHLLPIIQNRAARNGIVCVSIDDDNVREAQVALQMLEKVNSHSSGPRHRIHRDHALWEQDFLPAKWGFVYSWRTLAQVGTTLETGLQGPTTSRTESCPGLQEILAEMGEAEQATLSSKLVCDSQGVNPLLREALLGCRREALKVRTASTLQEMRNISPSDCSAVACRKMRRTRGVVLESACIARKRSLLRRRLEDIAYQMLLTDSGEKKSCKRPQWYDNISDCVGRQLLTAWYFLSYLGDFDQPCAQTSSMSKTTLMHGARLLLYRAFVMGWDVRVIGKYERSGKHIGFGKTVRRFAGHTRCEYDANRDTAAVQNRLTVTSDGETRGIRAFCDTMK